MSSIEPLVPGNELLQYKLTARIAGSVWRAEDTRSSKQVAIKILTRQLPKDSARREQLIRDVRLGAALYHPFLVPIHDVIAAGDVLAMVMEIIDAESLTSKLGGTPMERPELFRIAYQIADVLKLLQARNIVHGNVTGDSVMITPAGQVKLGGLNLTREELLGFDQVYITACGTSWHSGLIGEMYIEDLARIRASVESDARAMTSQRPDSLSACRGARPASRTASRRSRSRDGPWWRDA